MKIVVIDDDPTGSQTLHDCLLLLDWDVELLRKGLHHHSKILFVLANTRALTERDAVLRNREICRSLVKAIKAEGMRLEDILIVSRGDSTLRGHGFVEPHIISEEIGPFDATFHIPAFIEGGRTTVNGIHLLDGKPVHQTSFAKDQLFGYSTSDLSLWLEEKSLGLIRHQDVQRISLDLLNGAIKTAHGEELLLAFLRSLFGGQEVVVDAVSNNQLAVLGNALRKVSKEKRFLFRSAASFLNGLVDLPPKLIAHEDLVRLKPHHRSGGLVMVGSHVPLSALQLDCLLSEPDCLGVELNVGKILDNWKKPESNYLVMTRHQIIDQLLNAIRSRKTPVLYTSKREVIFELSSDRVEFGFFLAVMMADIVKAIMPDLNYLISKGGVTTNVLLSKNIDSRCLYLEGQLLPGLSVVRGLDNHENMPIVTFPGNLGERITLREAWRIMNSC